jgi:para-nitrobenzyl esterase
MRIKIWQAAALVLFLSVPVALAQVEVVVKTETGLVAGTGTDIHVWKGIPYARPPIGDLRWKPPQPAVPWQGIRHALEFGPMCPQGNPAQLKPDMSEDCLTLNVWSGAREGEQRPVFVWIHGGGFGGGSGRIDGEPLARLGIVVVSINYRLGVLGFMAHPELTRESPHHASGNYGLMDQIFALRWVKNNISAFGGDPDKVSIGGGSAGGTSIGYLIASPLAKGLFQGAWLDSASRLFLPDPGLSKTLHGLTPMEQVGLKVGPHIRELRALSTAEIMKRGAEAARELYGEGGSGRIGLKPESHVHMPNVADHPWWAFTDGYVMPAEVSTMFATGRFNHVACLIGTCRDEGLNFTRHMPDLTVDGYKDYLRKYYSPVSLKMFELYPGKTPDEIRAAITRIITDYMFLYGSIRTADYEAAAGERVYVERFMHVSPGAPGVMHGADGAYFRGDVRDGVTYGAVKYGPADERLSKEMMQRMAAFVKTFNPNADDSSPTWPAWTPKQRQYLEIGDTTQVRDFRDQAIIDLFRKQLGQ